MKALRTALGIAALALIGACVTPNTNEKVDPATALSGENFFPVALVVNDRCGSLDCHGSKYRNMRLYGFGSERLSPSFSPGSPETTQDEADQDYDSIVALEPDIMRAVIADRGNNPERLTFLRKARGHEAHKGGRPIQEGDAADVCIVSWLQSAVDGPTCKQAVPRLNLQ